MNINNNIIDITNIRIKTNFNNNTCLQYIIIKNE